MSIRNVVEKGSVRALGRGLLAWLVSAVVLCFLTACVIRAHGVRSDYYGYISAGLSFLCALLAGAAGCRGERKLGQGILCGAFLCLALLTGGILAGRSALDPSAVLSVVSFSFAGCVAGGLLFGGRKESNSKSAFRKKKQNRNS